jgi:gag-polypeptide of LTR copia-type
MSTKFAYKSIPQFDPIYYRAWSTDVENAFAERKWSDYLHPPSTPESATAAESSKAPALDPQIIVQANAFLQQSIPYEHKAGIEECLTAADIWKAFQQRYGSQSREDELRLEGQLLDYKKLATDTIEEHIKKF